VASERPAPRAGPSPLPVFAVIARPTQPVEAIPPRRCSPSLRDRRSRSKPSPLRDRRSRSKPSPLRDRRSRSKPSPPAGVRRHCETGAAGRSNPPLPVFAVLARPAQPVEAIPLAPPPNECMGRQPAYTERAGAMSECAVAPSPPRPSPCARDRGDRRRAPLREEAPLLPPMVNGMHKGCCRALPRPDGGTSPTPSPRQRGFVRSAQAFAPARSAPLGMRRPPPVSAVRV
jgi:hypothetical protein